jgi:membrane associated rhomboid family serine protease
MQFSATLAIVAVTVVVSILAWKNQSLFDKLILWPPAIARRGEYWRLLTHGFIHADGMHLIFNMVTLYSFGQGMEVLFSRLGLPWPWGFVGFYLSAILVAILPTYLGNKNNPQYRSLGASGAVSAVLFASILFNPWSMLLVFFIPMPAILFAAAYVAYSIWMDRKGGDNINHSAHLWGAGYGILFTLLLEPKVLELFWRRLMHPNW